MDDMAVETSSSVIPSRCSGRTTQPTSSASSSCSRAQVLVDDHDMAEGQTNEFLRGMIEMHKGRKATGSSCRRWCWCKHCIWRRWYRCWKPVEEDEHQFWGALRGRQDLSVLQASLLIWRKELAAMTDPRALWSERMSTRSVAQIMNDKTIRKYLQSIKRLITVSQPNYPATLKILWSSTAWPMEATCRRFCLGEPFGQSFKRMSLIRQVGPQCI